MRLTQFGIITLPELNGSDSGVGSNARSNMLELTDGAYDLDGNSIYLNPITISRSAVSNDDDLDEIMDNLFAEGRKGKRLLIATMRDGTTRQTFAKLTAQQRQIQASDYLCLQAYNMQWLVQYPFWLKSEDEPLYLDMGYELDESLKLDAGNWESSALLVPTVSTSSTFTITNDSKFPIYRVFFSIRTSSGRTTNNFTITNNTTGYSIYYANTWGDASSASREDFDCLAKRVYGKTDNDFNDLVLTGETFDWMVLAPGDNSFTFSVSSPNGGASIRLYVAWSTHYL